MLPMILNGSVGLFQFSSVSLSRVLKVCACAPPMNVRTARSPANANLIVKPSLFVICLGPQHTLISRPAALGNWAVNMGDGNSRPIFGAVSEFAVLRIVGDEVHASGTC